MTFIISAFQSTFCILGIFSKTGKTRVSHRVKMMTRWPGRERWPKWPIDPVAQWHSSMSALHYSLKNRAHWMQASFTYIQSSHNHPTFISAWPYHSSASTQHSLFIFGHTRSSICIIFFTNVRIHVYSPLCHLNLQSRNPLSIPFAHRYLSV